MKSSTSLDQKIEDKASFGTSRRSFLAASRIVLGAGAALAIGLNSSKALAQTRPGGSNGGGAPSCANSDGNSNAPDCRCFLQGTLIETTAGPVAIEDLRIGDTVLIASGGTKPIKWIGVRELTRDPSTAWAASVAPVKISRFAIDGKAPTRDLFVSPWHSIYIDGVLIAAEDLVNGVSIVANAKPDALSLTYFQIELDSHEAIVAEGLAVESYLGGSHEAFDNADEYLRLYGADTEPFVPFAPIVYFMGRRRQLASHLRSICAPVYDFRKPIDKVRDRLAIQAHALAA